LDGFAKASLRVAQTIEFTACELFSPSAIKMEPKPTILVYSVVLMGESVRESEQMAISSPMFKVNCN
jgi:hypothetical protein